MGVKDVTFLIKDNIFIKKYEENSLNWSGTDKFHTLSITRKGLCLLQRDFHDDKINKEYVTLQELKEQYITLRDFLTTSEYVGEEGFRTKPISSNDWSYVPIELNKEVKPKVMEQMSDEKSQLELLIDKKKEYKREILYRGDTHYLILETDNLLWKEPQLFLVSTKYIDDNWTFVGEINTEYKDPNKVYQKLHQQFDGYKSHQCY